MEKDTENQLLNELKKINSTLQELDEKVARLDSGKQPFILWDIIRSLLIGVLIVGPTIAVVIGIFQIISTWVIK